MASTFHHTLVLPSTYSPRFRRVACCLPATQQLSYEPINDLRVAFTAGETGGHIYPAVAIADELKIKSPNSQVIFVGAAKSMESTVVRSSGYDFTVIPSTVIARPLISPKNLFLPYRLIKALIKSFKILEDFEPQIVVGTGGCVSVPFCLAAALKGITLVIHEQNAYPGVANWFLSRFANLVLVAFNSTVDSFPKHKCLVSGNPVRFSLKRRISKKEAISHFFPKLEETENSSAAKLILVLGGSFGANSINIAILNLYYKMLSEKDNLFIIWQTGVESFNEMESLVRDHPHLLLKPFLRSMDLAYAAADLVISRAGAMTCSELLVTGKPSILIPSPNVAEGHQFKNASLMADLAGSRIITEDELDSITLETSIEELLGDEQELAVMAERALKGAKPDAATEIVQQIFSLVNSQPVSSTE